MVSQDSKKEAGGESLFNHNPLGLVRNRLRDHDAKDPIFKVGLDSILIDTGGEAESTMEFAHRAFRDPILGPILRLIFSAFSVFADLSTFPSSTRSFSPFVFNTSFVAASIRHLAGDATARGVGVVGGVFAFNATLDDEGVRVGEFDVDVLLFEARELALEFLGVFVLADVELGVEGADGG